jgi:hypothetical protein
MKINIAYQARPGDGHGSLAGADFCSVEIVVSVK